MDAPEKVCLLRLSAIGDTCHVVPLLRTLQDAWPRTRFTWVIGKLEAKLMSLIPDVELITVDKAAGLSAFSRLRTEMLRRGAFDLLLHLQLSIRASAAAACIRAPIKLGFDKGRARELQWLFTNRRIAPRTREHVQDSFSGFAEALGIARGPPRWAIPLPPVALSYAAQLIPAHRRTLVISACSSHRARNWLPERYAAVVGVIGSRHGSADTGLGTCAHGDHGEHSRHRPVCRHQSGTQWALPVEALVRGCLRRRRAKIPRQARRRAAVDAQDRSAGGHGSHRNAGR